MQIEERWSNASGKLIFMIPSKYAEYVQVVYEYVDADGNVVAEADLIVGQQYKMIAKLSGAGVDNFEITDEEGNVLEVPTQSSSDMFTYGQTTNPGDPSNPDNPDGDDNGGSGVSGWSAETESMFVKWMIAVGVMLGTITLVLFAIWFTELSVRSLRKKQAQK